MIKSIRIFLSLLLIFIGINSLKAQTCSFIPETFYCTGTTTTLYGSAPSGSATWSSSDSNIAPISSSGVLTPLNGSSILFGECLTLLPKISFWK